MPESPHKVELRVGGEVFGGWTRGRVRQSLDQFATGFELAYVDEWGERDLPWPIEEGDACTFLVDGEVLTDGYVDVSLAGYTVDTIDLAVEGRSKLGDLLDCDVVRKGMQWIDTKPSDILADLLEPFDVDFRIYGSEGAKFRRFKVEPGDTVAEVVLKLARLRGFLTADVGGVLELFRVDDIQAEDHLMRGFPILRAERFGSWAERFSRYIFRGQTAADDDVNGVAAARLKGVVEDRQVSRYRPKLILSGDADGDRDLGQRAIIERNQRAGRSERITLTVPGFRTERGALWRPGMGVHVADDFLRVDAVLIVVTVEMEFDVGEVGARDGGMVTTLELTRPEAYGLGEYPLRQRTQKLRTEARRRAR